VGSDWSSGATPSSPVLGLFKTGKEADVLVVERRRPLAVQPAVVAGAGVDHRLPPGGRPGRQPQRLRPAAPRCDDAVRLVRPTRVPCDAEAIFANLLAEAW